MTKQCQAHSWRLTEAGVVAVMEGPVEVTGMKGQQEGRPRQRPRVRRGWVPCAPGGSGLRWPEGSWWERVAAAGSEPPRAGGDQVKTVTQVVEAHGGPGLGDVWPQEFALSGRQALSRAQPCARWDSGPGLACSGPPRSGPARLHGPRPPRQACLAAHCPGHQPGPGPAPARLP